MARSLVPIGVLLVAGLCATVPVLAQQQAATETRDPSTPSLFDPHFDSGRTQQFQNPGSPEFRRPGTPARPGALAAPSSGAGAIGFDATNARVNQKRKDAAKKRARAEAENLPPIAATGPDRTVAPVFQRRESLAAQRRRAINTAAIPLDATGVIAARPIRKRLVEEDPFGPTGVYVGSFLYKPVLDASGGYNSNPNQKLNGKGSSFEKAGAELGVKSDWSRHEVSADLRGSYIWYNADKVENLNKPDIDLKGKARLDISKQTKGEFDGKFALRADNPGDPNLPNDVASPPMYVVAGGGAGIRHQFNRLEVFLRGAIDRTAYGDAELNNGQWIDLRDRNYNQFTGSVRTSYETMPGIKPFVEYSADARRHDRFNDAQGIIRNSDGWKFKGGTEFELTGFLIGEASVGWFSRDYVDPIFPNIHGLLLDGALTYFATPLTTMKLTMVTGVDESILPGVAGALRRDFGFQIDHAFRRWLIGTILLGYGTDNYEGSDRTDKRYIVSGGLVYKLSREAHFRAEARREWLTSTIDSQNYTSNIFTLGLRLMR